MPQVADTRQINLVTYSSPVGDMLLACSEVGLVSLSYLRKLDAAASNGVSETSSDGGPKTSSDGGTKASPGVGSETSPAQLPQIFARKYGVALERLQAAPSSQTDQASAQLDQYFQGQLKTWDLQLDWQLVNGFRKSALLAATQIPYGSTSSYRELAVKAGSPKAARAVGTAMAQNPFSIVVPCHRVVRTGGNLGNYGGGVEAKRWLLELESQA